MDWFLYDDGLRHERVKTAREKTQYSSKSFFRLTHFQKHSLEVFYKKIVLKNFAKVYKIHRKTPVPESVFNKFTSLHV